jgi:hypothetical protein
VEVDVVLDRFEDDGEPPSVRVSTGPRVLRIDLDGRVVEDPHRQAKGAFSLGDREARAVHAVLAAEAVALGTAPPVAAGTTGGFGSAPTCSQNAGATRCHTSAPLGIVFTMTASDVAVATSARTHAYCPVPFPL